MSEEERAASDDRDDLRADGGDVLRADGGEHVATDGGHDLAELAKRRGFFMPAAAAYGGVSGFYTFGPQGAALKRNIEDTWRQRFALQEGNLEVDAPTIMPEPVFEASGHLDTFDDMLVECPECGESHRADHVVEDHTDIDDAEALGPAAVEETIAEYELVCPTCGTGLAGQAVEAFNLMFETQIGPGSSQPGYLRPETAQGIFVEFPQLAEYARNQLPFGVTQIGRAYRNEISPRKSLLRVREFTQAELELFVDPEEDEPDLESARDVEAPFYSVSQQEADDGEIREATIGEVVDEGVVADPWIAYYLGIATEWYESIGVDMDRFRFRQHLPGERAHYAADCWDAEGEVDGDWIELAGFAYRSDYDLRKHAEYSDEEYTVFKQYDESITTETATVDPDMSALGPAFGGAAGDVAAALEELAERDPEAFTTADESVTVTVGGDGGGDDSEGESYEVPLDDANFSVEEVTESGEHLRPHVIEPSLGIDRALYTALDHSYREDEVGGETRQFLSLPAEVAPTTVGVFPLMTKDGLDERAQAIADDLRNAGLSVTYDDSGAIGRRYRRQDEVGTPYCVTVDYESLEDDDVTVRERDTTAQHRVPIDDLADLLLALRDGERTFDDL